MRKGYTLIEILVVATIIALLAAVGAASYIAFNQSGRDARRKADVEQIRAALEMYRSNNGTYPGSGVLTISCSGGSFTAGGNTYLSKIPTDPSCSGYSYYLNVSASGDDYTLGAEMEASDPGGNCGSCGSTAGSCNYCLGPYGQR